MTGLVRKSEVRFRKHAGALPQKAVGLHFSTYRTWRRKRFTARNGFSEKCTVLFLSFLRLKMKNLSPIRQSCDTIRLKPSIRGIAFLTHKSNFEQANLGDLGFCSPYSPLCFGYGVYSEMIMNLRMIKTMPIIL